MQKEIIFSKENMKFVMNVLFLKMKISKLIN
jgi:hypothetical protein